MTHARCKFGAVASRGFLYVCGGLNAPHELPVERFNPSIDAWETLDLVPQAFVLPSSACTIAGRLFGCAYIHDDDGLRSVGGVFNPSTGTWDPCPQMVVPRWAAALCALRV